MPIKKSGLQPTKRSSRAAERGDKELSLVPAAKLEAAEAPGKSVAGSQTVDRALALLKLIAESPGEGKRLLDLAKESGLDRATAYRLLTSLTNFKFVEQDAISKRYLPGLEFFALAAAASNRYDLAGAARGALERLSAATGDTATFCLRSDLNLVCIDVKTGDFPIKTLPMDIGSRRPLGAGAAGAAFLGALPEVESRHILEKVADRLTRLIPASLAQVEAAIAESRRVGYALQPDEPLGRIVGLAAPLMSRHGRPLGTLALSGIPDRFPPERLPQLLELLREQTRILDETVRRMPEGQRHRNHWNDAADARPVRRKARL